MTCGVPTIATEHYVVTGNIGTILRSEAAVYVGNNSVGASASSVLAGVICSNEDGTAEAALAEEQVRINLTMAVSKFIFEAVFFRLLNYQRGTLGKWDQVCGHHVGDCCGCKVLFS
jgi:hypothetical protein